jgi:pimeloyl-ACP methyl ester carboxylesterase
MAAWNMGVPAEAIATLREVMLMPRDIGQRVPRTTEDVHDVVVLVHGFLASAGVFRPLKKQLERDEGTHVASFSHVPGASVANIAFDLGNLVAKLPKSARVHIVGHSLGGVVARYYVQELGGHTRVTQTIALAAPFGGAPIAKRIPVFVGRDLHPQSRVVARKSARAAGHGGAPFSIAGTHDRTVPHAHAHALPHGEQVTLHGRGHNTLLFDEEVARLVVERIREFSV